MALKGYVITASLSQSFITDVAEKAAVVVVSARRLPLMGEE